MADQMMTSSMTSRDPERWRLWSQKSLVPVISKTARVRDSVTMGHLEEMESAVSNGHVTDEITDPARLTSWPSYC